MQNPIYYLNEKLMQGVNVSARAFNWVTGGTKKDLADLSHISATVLDISSALMTKNPFIISVFGTLMIGLTYSFINQNKKQIELENKAINRRAIDLEVKERYNFGNYLGGYMYSIMGANNLTSEKHSTEVLGLGQEIRAYGFLVMNADNLPPRKNCFKRGLEQLEKLIEDYQSKPEPAFSKANN